MSQEVVRKRYIIKPEYKKSALEEQIWTNTLVNGKQVTVKVGNLYRWGSFYIDLSDCEKENLLKKDSVLLNEYEDYELIEMWDGGCDFWVDIVDEDSYNEDEVEEINTLLYKWPEGKVPEYEDEDDDGYSEDKMELNEWYETDCEYTLSGPYELDEVEIDVATECC